MPIPDNESAALVDSPALPTDLSRPILHGWDQINLDDQGTDVRTQIQSLIHNISSPWRSMESIPLSLEMMVIDVLQQELDDTSCTDGYRTACMKCLLALSKARNIVPSSLSSRDVTREGPYPIGGGGFADIYKGRLHDTQVCLKVLRIFIPEKAREKLLRDFCREALVWRQLRHPNILPFLGVNKDLFAPSYCLISPWMVNGNIMSYLEAHPDHDRLTTLVQVAEGMKYLHSLDPPVVHSDIRGANILVKDDLCCCLADFGLSLFAESQALDSTSRMSRGSVRWLAPEYMDSTLFVQSYRTARDIYAYGCTIVEIFTGKPPFSEIKSEAGVIHEVLTKQNCPLRPPSNIFPDEGLWSLVMACLKTLSSRRPNVEGILEFLIQLQTTSEPDLDILDSYSPISPFSNRKNPSPLLTAPENVNGSTTTTPSIVPEYPNRAQALYPYEASPTVPDDLSFTAGEILYVKRTSQDWWEARKIDGSIGTVPSNFLRLVPLEKFSNRAQALYPYEASPADPNELSFTAGEILDVERTSEDWWAARKKDGSIGVVPSNFLRLLPLKHPHRARAHYSYEASPTDPNELSFTAGEILHVKITSNGWWEARKLDGSTGIVPSNYLRLLPPEYSNRTQALYPYEASPADPNELSFTAGEILDVERTSEDWWTARKMDGSIGLVPSNFLRLLPL